MPLRILVTAYEFSPKLTPGTCALGGLREWMLVEQLRRFCEVSVLTSSHNHVGIMDAVSGGALPGVNVHFLEARRGINHPPKKLRGRLASHRLWQRRAQKTALLLHDECPFDAAHFMPPDWDPRPPILSPRLTLPQFWGPVPPALRIPPDIKRMRVRSRIFDRDRRFLSGIRGERSVRLKQIEKIGAILLCDPTARQYFPRQTWKRLRFFPFGGVTGNEVAPPPRSAKPRRTFSVLAAGNLNHLDGYLAIIKAFHSLIQAGTDAALAIVNGNQDSRLRTLIEGLDIASDITLLDCLPLEELRLRLRETDLFVLPDFDPAAAPLNVYALASGVPVLAFEGGGGDVSLTKDWGVKLSWENEQQVNRDLASAMQKLAAHAGRRREMGRAALRHVRENLIWKRQGDMLEDLYAELLLQGENIHVRETEKGRFFY